MPGPPLMPSHRQKVLPKATGEIRPGMKGSFVDLQERDIPTVSQLLGRLGDFGILPTQSDVGGPSEAVTRYITTGAKRVPNIARRMEGTKNFLERMKVLGPDAENASKLFAERYPRIAAHMNVEHLTPAMQAEHPTASAFTGVGFRSKGEFPEQTPVLFGRRAYGLGQENMEDTLLHEGTHVAQDLGNKNALSMYNASTKALEKIGADPKLAYAANPFEISARTAASRKLGEKIAPYSALKGVDTLVEKLPPGSAERIELGRFRRR